MIAPIEKKGPGQALPRRIPRHNTIRPPWASAEKSLKRLLTYPSGIAEYAPGFIFFRNLIPLAGAGSGKTGVIAEFDDDTAGVVLHSITS